MPFIDLDSQVMQLLRMENGGTGNRFGLARGTVFRALNGSNLMAAGSTVTRTTQAYPVVRMTTVTDEAVLGVTIGTMDADNERIDPSTSTPNLGVAAVAVAGLVDVRLGANVTAGQYAYAHTTYGTAYSSATKASGAFGRFLTSGSSGGTAKVLLDPGAGAVIDHGLLTGLTDDDHTQYILKSLADAKGDLFVATAADTVTRLPLGATDGHVLTKDAAEATGMKWAAASGGAGGSYPWTEIIATADDTVTDSTVLRDHAPASGPAFTFAVLSGEVWHVDLLLVYSGNNATGDFKFRLNHPAVSSGWWRFVGDSGSSDLVTATSGQRFTAATATGHILGTDASHTPRMLNYDTMMHFTAGGNVTLQFANNSAAAGRESRVVAGSVLRRRQLV